MLEALALGWTLVAGSVELEALRRLWWPRRDGLSGPAAGARVLLVRPCAGGDPWLSEALVSLSTARYTFDLVCCIAVANMADPAYRPSVEAATALRAAGVNARVVLTEARAPNRKAAQLAAAIDAATVEKPPYEAVLIADGDVDLTGMDLDRLVGPLIARQSLAAVWAPPVEVAQERTLGDRALSSLLGASLHAFPVLARLDRAGLVGKLLAVRASALAEVGGFGELTRHLGEDMELGRRLRHRGWSIEAAPMVARSLCYGRTWNQAEERLDRWIKVIRAQRPGLLPSYPLLFFATIPILLLATLAAPTAPLPAALTAMAALGLRIAVALAASMTAGRPFSITRALTDALLADALLASSFVRAVRSRQVVWRNTELTVERGGLLRALPPP